MGKERLDSDKRKRRKRGGNFEKGTKKLGKTILQGPGFNLKNTGTNCAGPLYGVLEQGKGRTKWPEPVALVKGGRIINEGVTKKRGVGVSGEGISAR